MSDVFIIVTLSVLIAAWATAVLRRPRTGRYEDPIEGMVSAWPALGSSAAKPVMQLAYKGRPT